MFSIREIPVVVSRDGILYSAILIIFRLGDCREGAADDRAEAPRVPI